MLAENQWRIFQDKENIWHWKVMTPAGKVLKVSVKGTQSRTECLESARNNGYIGN